MNPVASVLMAARPRTRGAHEDDGEGTPSPSSSGWAPKHLGDVLYVEMKSRGMTEEELARQFGVAQSSINRWISGRTKPKGNRVNQIAKFCNIPMARAFQLNYSLSEGASEAAGLSAKVKGLEETVAEMADDLREVRTQQRIINQALETLLDNVKAAKARNAPRGK